MELNRYGLSAQFAFDVQPNSMQTLDTVTSQLKGLEKAATSTAEAIGKSGLEQGFKSVGKSMRQARVGQTSEDMQGLANAAAQVQKQMSPLKAEFRALKAEARNIDFGDIHDKQAFRGATIEVDKYVSALKRLEGQIDKNSFAEREFAATLRTQQTLASNRVSMASQQRKSALAAERLGASQSLKSGGDFVLSAVSNPLAQAREMEQQLGAIKKLAGEIGETGDGIASLKNNILGLSINFGTAADNVGSIFESLAGAGKDFVHFSDRIAEANQILENSVSLDVTVDKAAKLDIALGSVYRNSMDHYGGLVNLNRKFSSTVNVLTDNLQNVAIEAEGVLPIVTSLINKIGDSGNFKPDAIIAFAAALNSIDIEPELAGAFVNRMTSSFSKKTDMYAQVLGKTKAEFESGLNTDKLGTFIDLIKAYKGLKGGELEKGNFFKSLSIVSSQDKAIIQGLSNNLGVLTDATSLASKAFAEGTSVQSEWERVQQTSAFQTRRSTQAIAALKINIGLAISEAILPLMKAAGDLLTRVLELTEKYPDLTKKIAASVVFLASVASAAGGLGVVFFGLQQASATAAIAMLSLRRTLVPLTGFFQTAMGAFQANPIVGMMTMLRYQAIELGSGFAALFTNAGRVAFALGSFLTSPIVLATLALAGLFALVEAATPTLNVLGVVLSGLAAPLGFLLGLVQGIAVGFKQALLPILPQLQSAMAPIVGLGTYISEALTKASEAFKLFFGSGETIGKRFGSTLAMVITSPFLKISSVLTDSTSHIRRAWDSTIGYIAGLLTPFVQFVDRIGYAIVGALAEHSPGPTWQIRKKWGMTIDFISEKLQLLRDYISQNILPVLEQFALYLGRLSLLRYVAANVKALAGAGEGLSGSLFDLFTDQAIFKGLGRLIDMPGSLIPAFLKFSNGIQIAQAILVGFLKGIRKGYSFLIDGLGLSSMVDSWIDAFDRLFTYVDEAVENIVPRIIGWFRQLAVTISTALVTQFPILAELGAHLGLMVPALTALVRLGARFVPVVGVFLFFADAVRYAYLGLSGLQSGLGSLVQGLRTLSSSKGTPEWIRSILMVSPEVLEKRIAAIQRFQQSLTPAIAMFKNLNVQIQTMIQALLSGNFTAIQAQLSVVGSVLAATFAAIAGDLQNRFQLFKTRVGEAIDWVSENLQALPGIALAAAVGFGSNLAHGFADGFTGLVQTLLNTIPALVRTTLERLNLPNLVLLSFSSFPIAILSSGLKAQFISLALKVLPAALRLVGFTIADSLLGPLGPLALLIEGLAYALPVIVSAFISSGFSDQITTTLVDGVGRAIRAALDLMGMSVPLWASETVRIAAAINAQVKAVGHILAQIPLYLNPAVAAVSARFFQALPLLAAFAQRTGVIGFALKAVRQLLAAMIAPFRAFGQALYILLTGPPPDLLALLAPLAALFRPLYPLIEPLIPALRAIWSSLAPVLAGFKELIGPVLAPLGQLFSGIAAQIQSVLLPALNALRLVLAEVAALPVVQTLIATLGEAYAPVAAIAGVAAAGIAGAAMRAGAGALAGGRFVGGQVKSAVDVIAPKIAEGIGTGNKLLVWIGHGIYELVKKIVGTGIESIGFLKEAVDFSALGKINQNVGRVTPLDLLPFNEDDKLSKIRKSLSLRGIERDTIGPLTMAKYAFVAYGEAALAAVIVIDVALVKLNRQWDILIWGPKVARKAFQLFLLTVKALGDAYNGLSYILLRVSEQLIPDQLKQVAPAWAKVGAEILLVMKKVIVFGIQVLSRAFDALAVVLKGFQYVIVVPLIGVLATLRFALVVLQGTLRVLRGDFTPISGAIDAVRDAIGRLIGMVYGLRSVLIPIGLLGLILFNPFGVGIGLLMAGVIEATRGFRDIRNAMNTILSVGGFVVKLLDEIKWGLVGVGLAVGLGFNPFLRIAAGVIAYVFDMTHGFTNFDLIIGKVQGAIKALTDAIDTLLKALHMPSSFGPFQGIFDFFKDNWPFILAGVVAFNVLIEKSLVGGISKTFELIPKAISGISSVFNVLLGLMARVLPFLSKFRLEVDQLKAQALVDDVNTWRQNQFGPVNQAGIAEKEQDISRRNQMIRYRGLIANAAEDDARKSWVNQTVTKREGDEYRKVNLGKREGFTRQVQSQYQTFDQDQVEMSRQKVLSDPARLQKLGEKAGLTGFSPTQLQVLSTQEGLKRFLEAGALPEMVAKDIQIKAGQVTIRGDSLKTMQDDQTFSKKVAEDFSAGVGRDYNRIGKVVSGMASSARGRSTTGRSEIAGRLDEFARQQNEGANNVGEASTGLPSIPASLISSITKELETMQTLRGTEKEGQLNAGAQDVTKLRYMGAQLGVQGLTGGGAVPPILRELEAVATQARIMQHLKFPDYEPSEGVPAYDPKSRQPTPSARGELPVQTYANLIKRVQEGTLLDFMKGVGHDPESLSSAGRVLESYKGTRKGSAAQQVQGSRGLEDLIGNLLFNELITADKDLRNKFPSPITSNVVAQRRMAVAGSTNPENISLQRSLDNDIPYSVRQPRRGFAGQLFTPDSDTYSPAVLKANAEMRNNRDQRRKLIGQGLRGVSAGPAGMTGDPKASRLEIIKSRKDTAASSLESILTKSKAEGGLGRNMKAILNTLAPGEGRENLAGDLMNRQVRVNNKDTTIGRHLTKMAAEGVGRDKYARTFREAQVKEEPLKLLKGLGITMAPDKEGNQNYALAKTIVDHIKNADFDLASKKTKGQFGDRQIALLAKGAGVSTEELRYGKPLSDDDRRQASQLRSRKLLAMSRDAGFGSLQEMYGTVSGKDVPGITDKKEVKSSVFRSLLQGNFAEDPGDASARVSYALGMASPNDLISQLDGRNLLEEQKKRPLRERAQDFAANKLRIKASMPMGLESQAGVYEKKTRQQQQQRVAGLDNILYQRGISLSDLLKNMGSKDSAKEVREKAMTGNIGMKGAMLKEFARVLQVRPGDFENLEEFAPDGVIGNARVRLFRSLKDFKSALEAFAVGSLDGVQQIANLPAFKAVSGKIQAFKKDYDARVKSFEMTNANSLPMMVRKAGFSSAGEFGQHLEDTGFKTEDIAKIMQGKITGDNGIKPRDAQYLAEILGVEQKRLDKLTTTYQGKQPLPFAIESLLTGFRNLPGLIKWGVEGIIQDAVSNIQKIGKMSIQSILFKIKDVIQEATAKFTTLLGGRLMESDVPAWQRKLGAIVLQTVNLVGFSFAKIFTQLGYVASSKPFGALANVVYGKIPKAIRGLGDSLDRVGFGFTGISGTLYGVARSIEVMQAATGGTIQGAIQFLFNQLGQAFSRMAGRVRQSFVELMDRLGITEALDRVKTATAPFREGAGKAIRGLFNNLSVGGRKAATDLQAENLKNSKAPKFLMSAPKEGGPNTLESYRTNTTLGEDDLRKVVYDGLSRRSMKTLGNEDLGPRSYKSDPMGTGSYSDRETQKVFPSREIEPSPDPGLLQQNVENLELKGLRAFADLTHTIGQNLAEFIEHPMRKLSSVAQQVGDQMSLFLSQPATRVGMAWQNTINFITGRLFPMLWAGASSLGRWLGEKLNHGAADVTSAAWLRTEGVFDNVAEHMQHTAAVAGEAIAEGLTTGATVARGSFGKLMGVISNVGGLSMGLSGISFALEAINPVLGAMVGGFAMSLSLVYSFIETLGSLAQMGPDAIGLLNDALNGLAPTFKKIGTFAQSMGIKAVASIRLIGAAIISSPATLGIAAIALAAGALYAAIRTDFLGLGKLFNWLSEQIHKFFAAIPIPFDQIHAALDTIKNSVFLLPSILTLGTAALIANFDKLPLSAILVSKFKEALAAVAPIGAKIAATMAPHMLKVKGMATAVGGGGSAALGGASGIFQSILGAFKNLPAAIRQLPQTLESSIPKLIRRWDVFNRFLLRRWFPRFFVRLRKSFLGFFNKVVTLTTRKGMSVTRAAEKVMPGVGKAAVKSGLSMAMGGGIKPSQAEELIQAPKVGGIEEASVKLRTLWSDLVSWMEKHVLPKFATIMSGIVALARKMAVKLKGLSKGIVNMFLGPIDVLTYGLSGIASSLEETSPALSGFIDGVSTTIGFADMAGNAFLLLKGKLPAPFKALVKSILESNPVLKKAAKLYEGMTEGGFGFLNDKFGPRVKEKFGKIADIAGKGFLASWGKFKGAWVGMFDGIASVASGITSMLAPIGKAIVEKSVAIIASNRGISVSNVIAAESFGSIPTASTTAAVTTAVSSQSMAVAVAEADAEIGIANLTAAQSFFLMMTAARTATGTMLTTFSTAMVGMATAFWTAFGPILVTVGGFLAPILPVVLVLAGAMALFGIAWKTNFLGLGSTFGTLFKFTLSLFKIGGAILYVLSGAFIVVQAFKFVLAVLTDIGYRIKYFFGDNVMASFIVMGAVITAILIGIAVAFGVTLSPVIVVIGAIAAVVALLLVAWKSNFLGISAALTGFLKGIVRVWKFANYLADAVLGIGDAGKRMSMDLHITAHRMVGALLHPIDTIKSAWQAIADWFGSTFGDVFKGIGDQISQFFMDPLKSVKEMFFSFLPQLNKNPEYGKKNYGPMTDMGSNTYQRQLPPNMRTADAAPVAMASKVTAASAAALVASTAAPPVTMKPGLSAGYSLNPTSMSATAAPADAAAAQVNTAWTGVETHFDGVMGNIVDSSQVAGKGTINFLNHSPTVQIPLAWESAATSVNQSIASMTDAASLASGEMSGAFVQNITVISGEAKGLGKATSFLGKAGANGLGDSFAGAAKHALKLFFIIKALSALPLPLQTAFKAVASQSRRLMPLLPLLKLASPGIAGAIFDVGVAGLAQSGMKGGMPAMMAEMKASSPFVGQMMSQFETMAPVIASIGVAFTDMMLTIAPFGGIIAGALAGLVAMFAIAEYFTPEINLLGQGIGYLLYPIGLVVGAFQGISDAMTEVFGPMPDVMGAMKTYASDVISTFTAFFEGGKMLGHNFAHDLFVPLFENFQSFTESFSTSLQAMLTNIPGIGKLFDTSKSSPIAPTPIAPTPPPYSYPLPGVKLKRSPSTGMEEFDPRPIPKTLNDPRADRVGVASMYSRTSPAITSSPLTPPPAGALAQPLLTSANQVDQAWAGFGLKYAQLMTVLPVQAELAGMGTIEGLNHNPTVKIPLAWDKAADKVNASIDSMTANAKASGDDISGALSGSAKDSKKAFSDLGKTPPILLPSANIVPPPVASALDGSVAAVASRSLPTANLPSNLTHVADFATGITTKPGFAGVMSPSVGEQSTDFFSGAAGSKSLYSASTNVKPPDFFSGAVGSKSPYSGGQAAPAGGKVISQSDAQASVKQLQTDVTMRIDAIKQKAIDAGTTALTYLADLPAKVIPQKWQVAYRQVVKTVGGVASAAVTLAKRAAAAVGPVFATMKTQWQTLALMTSPGQMPTFGNFVSLISPQINELKEAGSDLMNATVYLLANSADALVNLDFGKFKTGLLDYGASFKNIAGMVVGSLANMTLSAVVFGAFSVFSFSPVLAIMLVVGAAAFLLATNFLGLRSIIVGVTKVAWGMLKIVYGLIMGLREVIGGVLMMIGGLFDVLRGDFTLLKEGWQRVCNGMKLIAISFVEGVKSIFSGMGDILKGIFEALAQVVKTVFGFMGAEAEGFVGVVRGIGTAITTTADLIATAVTSPLEAWKKFLSLLENILNRIRGIKKSKKDAEEGPEAASAEPSAAKQMVGQVKNSRLGKYARAVKQRITGEAPSLESAKQQVDFDTRLETSGKPQTGFLAGLKQKFGKKTPEEAAFDANLKASQQTHAENLAQNVPQVALPLIFAQMLMHQEETKKNWHGKKVKVRVPTLKGKGSQQAYENHVSGLSGIYNEAGGGAAGMEAVSGRYESLRKQMPEKHLAALGEAHKKITAVHQEHFGDTEALSKNTSTMANGMRAGSNAINNFGMQLYSLSPAAAAPVMMLGNLTQVVASVAESVPTAKKAFDGLKSAFKEGGTTGSVFADTIKNLLVKKLADAKIAAGEFAEALGPKLREMAKTGASGVLDFIKASGPAMLKFFKGVKDGSVTFGTVMNSTGKAAEGGLDKVLGGLNVAFKGIQGFMKGGVEGAATEGAEALGGLGDSTIGAGEAALASEGMFAGMLGGIGSAVSSAGTLIMTALGAIPGIGWIILAVMAVVAGLVFAFQTNFMGIGDMFGDFGKEIGKLFGYIGSFLGAIWNFIVMIGMAVLAVPLAVIVVPIMAIVKVLTWAFQLINWVVGGIGALLGWIITLFTNPVAAIRQMLGFIVGIGSAVVGFFHGVANAIASPFQFVWSIFSAIGSAIGGMINAFIGMGSSIANSLATPFQWVMDIVSGIGNILFQIASLILNIGFSVVRAIALPFVFVSNIVSQIGGSLDALGSGFNTLGAIIMAPFQFIWGVIQGIGSFIGGIGAFFGFGGGGGAAPEQHARGGLVGYGSGGKVVGAGNSTNDAIQALLSRGEFVVNASATSTQLPLLQAMNGGVDVLGAITNMIMQQSPSGSLQLDRGAELNTLPMPFLQPTPRLEDAAGQGEMGDLPPIEINFNIASITLGGGSSVDQAMEFLETMRPYLQHEVRDLLRDLVDRTK